LKKFDAKAYNGLNRLKNASMLFSLSDLSGKAFQSAKPESTTMGPILHRDLHFYTC